mmetsp:Transcript_85927/g.277492  ORF Transcript_85927/g.277492 Transcript_85927/m.277492 type:complete len:115 (-) Transcript_85927:39-383(-)
MAAGGPARQRGGEFKCSCCGFRCRYDYFGRDPPFASPGVRWLEDVYAIENPAQGELGRVKAICLGAPCCACGEPVCVEATCSLFYTKRFCKRCAAEAREHFPPALDKDLRKLLH